jgi:hypothetical protein
MNRQWVGRKNLILLVMVGLMLTSMTGCGGGMFGFGAKRLLNEVKGGEGQLVIIKDPGPAALMEYQNVRIERFSSQIGSALPGYTTGVIHDAVVREMVKKPKLYNLVSPESQKKSTLIIRGQIIHYQASSGISSVFSSFSQLICRVELVDAASGKIIGQANCVGLSKAIARSGIEELSEGVAKAVKKWLTTSPKKNDED